MNKVLLVCVLILSSVTIANAQKKGWTVSTWCQGSNISLNGHSELRTADLVVAPGYAFNRYLFVRLQAEFSIGLFDVAPVRTYQINDLLGASVGCNVANWKYWGLLEVALTAGNTLSCENWRFMYYDAAIRWNLPLGKDTTKLSFGIGARYYQSHNSHNTDFCNLYAGIGFVFN